MLKIIAKLCYNYVIKETEVGCMPKIIPIKDMINTAKLSEMCHATQEPVYVTKNGYGDMVVLSMEAYESRVSRAAVFDELMKGKEQADRGELLDGGEVLASLRAKYGKHVRTEDNAAGV